MTDAYWLAYNILIEQGKDREWAIAFLHDSLFYPTPAHWE